MKITPYRVRFEADIDNASGKFTYSKPTSEMLEVELSKDGTYYEIHTHDRGDSEVLKPYYYQIAFRIEDPTPYQMDELSLSLDSYMYRNRELPLDCNLYCDPQTRNIPTENLWYQRSRYEKKNDTWKVVTQGKKALPVDCITTSGVFKIVVLRNGAVLPSEDIPWVYVLPSSVSKDDYLRMLNDLINLHEKLVSNDSKSLGVKKTYTEIVTAYLKKDLDFTQELLDAVLQVTRLPSELQGKRYSKTTINKVKHFDASVVRDYIKMGCSGKVTGIEYYEDHDTYENRIIKYVLKRLEQRHKNEEPIFLSSSSLDELVEQRYDTLLSKNSIASDSQLSKKKLKAPNNKEANLIKKELQSSIMEELECNRLKVACYRVHCSLNQLLHSTWFSQITDIGNVEVIRPTPKFLSNVAYSKIFRLITILLEEHPLLSFDANAFGVNSTDLVYEYWIFYRMLDYLGYLGFTIKDKQPLTEYFKDFLNNLSNDGKVKAFTLHAIRMIGDAPLEIEIGNEHIFRETPSTAPLTPDYYLKTVHNRKYKGSYNYWYFLDAKYNSFTCRPEQDSNYYQMINDVAVNKYIVRMSQILNGNPETYGEHNFIQGVYLLAADIDDSSVSLSENGRLFGSLKSILDIPEIKNTDVSQKAIIDNSYGLPGQRYGMVKATPSDDHELRAMFQMIFEYHESEHYTYGNSLFACWRCKSTELTIEEDSTAKGNTKKFVTCRECHAFREETLCHKCGALIIKHASNNYHMYNPDEPGSWSFICPNCGGVLAAKIKKPASRHAKASL